MRSGLRSTAALLVLLGASQAWALVDVPTTDRRALDLADLATGSGRAGDVDTSAAPLDDLAYLRAYEALTSVGLVDDTGERLSQRAAARQDGKLHLEGLAPLLDLRLYGLAGGDSRLLYHRAGDMLEEGFNVFLSAAGDASWGTHLGGSYEVQLQESSGDLDAAVKRLYLKGVLGKWSAKVGRDTLRLGPGYHSSLLLDDNTEPLDLWQIRTEEPLFLPGPLARLGGFRFTVFNAYLSDEHPSAPDPRYGSGVNPVKDAGLLGMRLSYHPASWLDFGVSRTVLYGGEGRQTYTSPRDWWELFSGLHENVHTGESHRYDNDQYAALDLTIRLPFVNGLGPLKAGKVYWEYAGTDVIANWKSGRGTGSWVPFRLDDVANLGGLYLSSAVSDMRLEYAETSVAWYQHTQYPQGYSYRGLPLGHHMGGDAQDFFVQVSRSFGPEWRAAASLDLEERGRSRSEPEKRTEGGLSLETYHLGAFGLPLTGRAEAQVADVRNALDDPDRNDRTESYVGVTVEVRL